MTSKRVIQKSINKDNSKTYKSNIGRLHSNSHTEKIRITTCFTKPNFGCTLGSLVNPSLRRIKERNLGVNPGEDKEILNLPTHKDSHQTRICSAIRKGLLHNNNIHTNNQGGSRK